MVIKFCKNCLYDWLDRGKDSCPLCRCPIREFKHSDIIYKIVKIPRSTRQQNQQRHRVQQNEVIRNTRLKYYYYLMLISLIGLGNMYLVLNSNYVQLEHEYSECLRNNSYLDDLLENYYSYNDQIESGISVSILSLGSLRKCYIPVKTYMKCFTNK